MERDRYNTDTIVRHAHGVRCVRGQHMHFDARDLDWYHRVVIAGIVKAIEPHLYSMLPSSRRNNRYCIPMSQRWSDFKYVKDRDSFVDFWYDTCSYNDSRWNDKRYYGLNMHPGPREGGMGSIEIRYHNGTLNKTKMKPGYLLDNFNRLRKRDCRRHVQSTVVL